MSLNFQFKNSYCFQNLFLGIPLIGCLKHSMYINIITFILFVWLTVSTSQHHKCLPVTWQHLPARPLRSWPLIPSVLLSPFPEILVNLNLWLFVPHSLLLLLTWCQWSSSNQYHLYINGYVLVLAGELDNFSSFPNFSTGFSQDLEKHTNSPKTIRKDFPHGCATQVWSLPELTRATLVDPGWVEGRHDGATWDWGSGTLYFNPGWSTNYSCTTWSQFSNLSGPSLV